jgi:Ca2+-binding EF-hand superfamily protein
MLMRVNEVTQLEGEKLFEALDATNDTGVDTNDLVKMVNAHRSNKWQRMDGESLDSFLDNLAGK